MQQKAKTPKPILIIFSALNISPEKKTGMKRKRFFAQSLGLRSLRYATCLICVTKYKQKNKMYNVA